MGVQHSIHKRTLSGHKVPHFVHGLFKINGCPIIVLGTFIMTIC